MKKKIYKKKKKNKMNKMNKTNKQNKKKKYIKMIKHLKDIQIQEFNIRKFIHNIKKNLILTTHHQINQ